MSTKNDYLAKGGIDKRSASQKRAQEKAKTLADIMKKTHYNHKGVKPMLVEAKCDDDYNGENRASIVSLNLENVLSGGSLSQVKDKEKALIITMNAEKEVTGKEFPILDNNGKKVDLGQEIIKAAAERVASSR